LSIPFQSAPYEWNPATLFPKVPETSILGIEAPIWVAEDRMAAVNTEGGSREREPP
jgi:hypothetical protein